MGETEQKVYTISQASIATGYSVEHLRELCARGIVTPRRIALGRLFSHSDIRILRTRRAKTVKQQQKRVAP